ncbi:hypothetical protein [Balneola vulgaris]|uniref:hypothetical protein n=1 Tax=Balneola vulgaris TaxID=287535 RepID=UPI0003825F8B|nr:hypothetical protein [Balneola vulgaris]
MKKLSTTLAVFLALFSIQVSFAQQSDFQIKEAFEAKHETLSLAIEDAQSVDTIDSLLLAIDNFQDEYNEHQEMLDYALYPESYESKIADLRSKARTAEHKLLVIENQSEKLSMLTDELNQYKSELALLTQRSDSLRLAISNSQESEENLSRLVRNYRQSVEQRDQFIFDMVDSLFITYKQLAPESIDELSKQNETGTLASGDNPLETIELILEENVETLKAEANTLNTEDYLRIYALHHKVEEVWNSIGDDLIAIYGGKNKNKWNAQIENNLKEWKASASLSMWKSLDNYLENKDVDLGAFDSNSSFFKSLDSFVSKARDQSEGEILNNTTYEDYKTFREFWSTKVLNDWNQYLVEAEVLTTNQIATIDNKVDDWEDKSKPLSTTFIILFGIAVLAVIGFIVLLVKQN